MLAPMPTARAALAAVTGRDGRIYAVGGTIDVLNQATDESPPLRASGLVEAYDPQTNRWSAEPSLRVPRYALAAVAAPDGRIYAIGGSDTDAVEALTVPAPAKP